MALVGDGRLVQLGSPADVYARPASLWAARLTGPASVLTAVITAASRDVLGLRVGEVEVRVPAPGHASSSRVGEPRQVLLRPDWTSAGGSLSGRLDAIAFRGPHTDYVVAVGEDRVLVRRPGPPRHAIGSPFSWSIDRVGCSRRGT